MGLQTYGYSRFLPKIPSDFGAFWPGKRPQAPLGPNQTSPEPAALQYVFRQTRVAYSLKMAWDGACMACNVNFYKSLSQAIEI